MRKRRQARAKRPLRLLLVKTETQSFYEIAVSRAVERVASHLDEVIDMGALARQAALSPFPYCSNH